MRRILPVLAGIVLALAIVGVTAAAKPFSIDAVQDVVALGDRVDVEWSAGPVKGSVWSHMACLDAGDLVLASFTRLDDPEPDAHFIGITPSWDGSAPLSCTVSLRLFNDGTGTMGRARATDSFAVEPGVT
jgi:hypothetical protein